MYRKSFGLRENPFNVNPDPRYLILTQDVREALACLRLGLSLMEEGRVNMDGVQAIQSIGVLQQKGGSQEAALRWGKRALHVAQKLGAQTSTAVLSRNKKWIGLLLAFAVGWELWQISPPPPLDERGVHLLASLAAAITLWVFDLFDQHVVTLLLLLTWILLSVVPSEMALAGFSETSWFFLLGVLGIGAAVTKSGLLYRVALQVLRRIPPDYKIYTFTLAASGLLVTPMLPDDRGRIAIMGPLSQAISESIGFKPRSSGSAGLVLSAYIGYSQMAFMFLTGASTCLIGWNLLAETVRSEFGWGNWTLAAFPAGIFTLLFLSAAILLLFPLKEQEQVKISPRTIEAQLEILGPLTRGEWLSLAVIGLALVGWSGKPFHGISEAWVALGAFLVFLITGVLDKNGLRNNIDWGFLIFFGVMSSLAGIMSYLKVDIWLKGLMDPVLSMAAFHPLPLLILVALLVYLVRFFINKTPGIILLTISLTSWAQHTGIHPGVILLTILIAIDSWFLPYQTINYQIAYYSTEEKAFSHAQARKLMVAKFIASLLAITISVPYWKMLGFIH
jgi:anion transporter